MKSPGSALRHIMLTEKRTPTDLAAELSVSVGTVLSWLDGRHLPLPSTVFRIGEMVGDEKLELLSAVLYTYHQRTYADRYGAGPFNAKAALKEFIRRDAWRLRDDELKKLFAILEHPSFLNSEELDLGSMETSDGLQNRLVILPKPTVLIARSWRTIAQDIARGASALHDLPWRRFEDLVAGLLESYGWAVSPMGYTKDDGVDIIAVRSVEPSIRFAMLVQCKRYAHGHPVGVSVVRELWSTKWEKGFHQAMLATSSSFTRGAKEKATQWNMELKDHDAILSWCQNLTGVAISEGAN